MELINEALDEMHDSGEYERIIKNNLGDAIQPGAKPDIGDLSFVNS